MKPAPDTRRHQGLITSGVIIASLMLLFVLGTAAFTSIKIKTHRVQQELQDAMDDLSLDNYDSIYSPPSERAIDYSMVYTEQTLASVTERNITESDLAKAKLKKSNNNTALRKLIDFENKTNLLCAKIRVLRQQLNDTIVKTGDYGNSALSIAFFNTDNRTDNLLFDIKNHRDISLLDVAPFCFPDQLESAKESLPLNDGTGKSPIGYWDETRFYDTPEKAAQYLLELELAVRYFEYDIITCYNN
ncbi:MAG: hypothetical protein ACK5Z2_06645 [Bacteroidota bacterium]|jgi:hypothetical protein